MFLTKTCSIITLIISPEDYLLNSSNWKQLQGGIPSINGDILTVSAVKRCSTVGEFTNSSDYILEFDYQFDSSGSNQRSYFHLFHDPEYGDQGNTSLCLIRIGGDITSNGFKSIYVYDNHNEDRTGAETVQTISKFNTSGNTWHHFKIIRNNQHIQLYVANTLMVDHTFNTPVYNTFFIWKWQSGNAVMKNIKTTFI